MSTNLSFERQLASWMADEAATSVPAGAIDHAISVTGRLRPRPRWLALLKETPMRTQSRVLVGSPARRLALVIAALALVTTAVVAGAYLLNRPSAAVDWSGYRGGPGHAGLGASGPIGSPVQRWQYRADGAANRGIAIAGRLAIVPTDDGVLQAIDLTTGLLRWSATVEGVPGGAFASDGRVFVGDGAGVISAFDVATGSRTWRSTGAIAASPELTGGDGLLFVPTTTGELVALDAATGAERWRTTVSADGSSLHPPAYDAGRIFVSDAQSFYAVDGPTGQVSWTATIDGQQTAGAVASGLRAYVGVPADGAVTGGIKAFDQSLGTPLWTIPELLYSPSVDGNAGYAGSPGGLLAAIDLQSGAVRWRAQFDGPIRPPSIAQGAVFVAAAADHAIHALDATTGGELWRFPVDGSIDCCLAVADGLIVVGTTNGSIYAIDGNGGTLAVAPLRTPGASVPEVTVAPTASLAPPIGSLVWSATAPDTTFVSASVERAPDGNLWVTDPMNGRFAIFSAEGKFVEFWGEKGSGEGQFNLMTAEGNPEGGVAFAKDGSFFVLDAGNRRVQAFDRDRRFLTTWGGFGTEPGKFSNPVDIAVAPDGSVSVVDGGRAVIETYDAVGHVLHSFQPLEGRSGDVGAFTIDEAGRFHVLVAPDGMRTFDSSGQPLSTIPLGDEGFTRIATDETGRTIVSLGLEFAQYGVVVFDADGQYVGGFGPRGRGEGQLLFPWGIATGPDGSVYVAEFGGDPGIGALNQLQRFQLELPAP